MLKMIFMIDIRSIVTKLRLTYNRFTYY